jgi:pimeloyl-ACP methyl ester carboxylesterase
LHPASDRSRDHFLFRHLAKVLPPKGIAVARFDRRGDDVPLDDQVEDVMSVIAELETKSEIDSSRIGLWGFSQGAWVAPLAASRSPKIAFLVLLASTGVSPAEQMLYGTAKQARLAGFGEDAATRIADARRVVDAYRRGTTPRATAQQAIDRIGDEPFFEHAWVPRHIDDPMAWPDMDFDPEPIFAGVHVPTLLFYGEDDEWSPIDASVATWERAAQRARNHAVTIIRLPGTGHTPTVGGAERIEAVAPDYERTMVDWLGEVTRSG